MDLRVTDTVTWRYRCRYLAHHRDLRRVTATYAEQGRYEEASRRKLAGFVGRLAEGKRRHLSQ